MCVLLFLFYQEILHSLGGIENLAQVRFLLWWLLLPFSFRQRLHRCVTEDVFLTLAACQGEEQAGL